MARTKGTDVGCEDVDLRRTGLQLWIDAFLVPVETNGGPPDANLVSQALSLPFGGIASARELGREVLGLVQLSIGEDSVTHLDTDPHFEEEHVVADLSADRCRRSSATLALVALQEEIEDAGTGAAVVAMIPADCPALPFGAPCTGAGALECMTRVVQDVAFALRACDVCDIDRNGVIDRLDIAAIFEARNSPANAADRRDADGDNIITVNDGRICVTKCTNPLCAPVATP